MSRRLQGERYLGVFDVEVFRQPTDAEALFAADAVDLSNSGVLLVVPASVTPPEIGSELFLRFAIPPGNLPEGYESRVSVAATAARYDPATRQLGLQFLETLDSHLERRRWRWFEWAGMLTILLTLVGIAYLRVDSIFYFVFDVPVFFYGICASIFLVSRFAFAMFYRSVPVDPGYTPSVSIIIPCFNEEKFITRTIRCALDQDYPPDKLQVILVDDGSTDRSVERACLFKEKVKDLIEDERFVIIVHEANSGKREVMATGTRTSKAELLVFVDSDSFLEPDAIRQLVQPLKDPRIGAVCGRCDVENKWTNYLTKMQTTRYYIAFRIFKAAESVFHSVTCLSGPISCYRREVVVKHLPAWLGQTFLGRRATFGDDRSLTNFMLPDYWITYQHTAACSTIVPSSMRQFIKQQMRWKRSWLRESLRAAGFMWKREPFMALSFYAGLIMPLLAPFVVLRAFVFIPIVYGYFPFVFIIGFIMMAMLVSATYLILKRSYMWVYGGLFCLFYLTVLLWQMLPATLTFWKSEWGTRATSHDIKPVKAKKIVVAANVAGNRNPSADNPENCEHGFENVESNIERQI